MEFRDLGLTEPILTALRDAQYTAPTPIQEKAIPPALAGRDVLGCAQTGTGKTCAFAAPILQRLRAAAPKPRYIRALILTPTRELAIQIGESFDSYGRNLSLRHAVIFGGVGQQPQADAIRRGLDILVATPGRLLDLQGQGLLDLSRIEIFVLDEADRMLDMGFIHDVKRVLRLLPEKKQTLFFSATMPPEVMDLVNSLLHDYVRVAVDPVSSPVEVIRQSLYYVDKANKAKLLAYLIDTLNIPSALVFSRTKHGANRIAQDLQKRGIPAAAIHGNKSQTARIQALGDFKAGRVRVLAATDIAARGIDIEELPYVFNYNLPDVPETYVHRIGRTGRAGHEGAAISFCQFDEKDELRAIEKLLGRKIPVVEDHPYPMTDLTPPQKDKHGRPINAEDAEARAAARERRQERAAAEKAAKEKASKEKAPQEKAKVPAPQPAPAASGEDAPAKKKRRRRKKSTAQAAVSTPQVSESPAETAGEGSRPGRSQSARGVRQGRLDDTLPSAPSLPSGDFYKPNPLDSDVIMDATARLLSSRRPAQQRAPRQEGGEGRNSRRGGKAPSKAGPQSAPPQKGAQQPKKAAAQEKAAPKKQQSSGSRRSGGHRAPAQPPRSTSYQKDSTEQHTLMRPYYLSDDR